MRKIMRDILLEFAAYSRQMRRDRNGRGAANFIATGQRASLNIGTKRKGEAGP
jgi:hypothetical protein